MSAPVLGPLRSARQWKSASPDVDTFGLFAIGGRRDLVGQQTPVSPPNSSKETVNRWARNGCGSQPPAWFWLPNFAKRVTQCSVPDGLSSHPGGLVLSSGARIRWMEVVQHGADRSMGVEAGAFCPGATGSRPGRAPQAQPRSTPA
eukprot:4860261-Prymnesium_polylepis.2